MKLEEAKKLKNLFKSNLKKTSRGRHKFEEQKMISKNIKLLYKSREAVIKLFKDYSSVASEAKYKTIRLKRIPSMSSPVACGKFSDHSNLKNIKSFTNASKITNIVCTSKSR